jgi:hypothetical protein
MAKRKQSQLEKAFNGFQGFVDIPGPGSVLGALGGKLPKPKPDKTTILKPGDHMMVQMPECQEEPAFLARFKNVSSRSIIIPRADKDDLTPGEIAERMERMVMGGVLDRAEIEKHVIDRPKTPVWAKDIVAEPVREFLTMHGVKPRNYLFFTVQVDSMLGWSAYEQVGVGMANMSALGRAAKMVSTPKRGPSLLQKLWEK